MRVLLQNGIPGVITRQLIILKTSSVTSYTVLNSCFYTHLRMFYCPHSNGSLRCTHSGSPLQCRCNYENNYFHCFRGIHLHLKTHDMQHLRRDALSWFMPMAQLTVQISICSQGFYHHHHYDYAVKHCGFKRGRYPRGSADNWRTPAAAWTLMQIGHYHSLYLNGLFRWLGNSLVRSSAVSSTCSGVSIWPAVHNDCHAWRSRIGLDCSPGVERISTRF